MFPGSPSPAIPPDPFGLKSPPRRLRSVAAAILALGRRARNRVPISRPPAGLVKWRVRLEPIFGRRSAPPRRLVIPSCRIP